MRSRVTALVGMAALTAGCPSLAGLSGDAGVALHGADAASDAAATDAGAADARTDAAPRRCTASARFGPPRLVAELSTPDIDGAARLLPDENTIYFHRGVAGDFRLFVATRSGPTASFAQALPVAELNLPGVVTEDPSPTRDGRTLFFSSNRGDTPDAGTTSFRLWAAHRSDVNGTFDAPKLVAVTTPFDAVETYVLPSATALYFSDRTQGHVLRAPLVAGEVGAPVTLDELGARIVGAPVPSDDEHTLYFYFYDFDAGATHPAIWVGSRDDTRAPFSDLHAVSELSAGAAYEDIPKWLSPDGCRLYFDSNRPGGQGWYDIYVAEKVE